MTDNIIPTPARRGVPLWAQIIVWGVLVGLLVIVAITLNRSQQGTVQPGDRLVISQMTMFTGYELNGQTQAISPALKGKVVMINFWASWCKPCEQEAADLRSAWQYYKDNGQVVFIGMDYVDTEPEARAYLEKFDITYPMARTSAQGFTVIPDKGRPGNIFHRSIRGAQICAGWPVHFRGRDQIHH